MDIFIKDYESYINEQLSAHVFHYTTLVNATSIIKFNRFYLSSIFNSIRDNNNTNNYKYFLSVTRDKNINKGYANGKISHNEIFVRFELYADKLSQRYKTIPFNYHSQTANNRHEYFFESEERILSNNRTIPNATNYIKQITIILKNENSRHSDLEEMIYFTNKSKIPINFFIKNINKYYNIKDFFNSFPNKKPKLKNKKNINKSDYYLFSYLFLNILYYNFDTEQRKINIDKYLASYNISIPNNIKKEVNEMFYNHDIKTIINYINSYGMITTIGDSLYDSIINKISNESINNNENMIEFITKALGHLC